MSYAQFLLVFLVIPIGLLWQLGRGERLATPNLSWRLSMILVAIIAFAYTTPWDNYLVYAGVWYYGDARVVGTIGYVPVEEYLFFLLQPVLTGLWLRRLLIRHPGQIDSGSRWTSVLAPAFALLTILGVLGLYAESPKFTYGGLILSWAAPVLFALAVFGRKTIARYRWFVAVGIGVPTLFLWVADTIAIGLGIWTIASETSVGIEPFGLPVEEALFFLVTNALVVLGLLVFAYGPRPRS